MRCAALVAVAITALFVPSVAEASLTWSQPIAVDHNGQQRLVGLACSSSTQCVAIDGLGQTVTFNPASPGAAKPVVRRANASFAGIACPSDQQCTAVDSTGRALTFDPGSSSGASTVTIASAALVSIACPAVHQCTTLDESGNEETFDPASPGTVTPVPIDGTNAPAAIQCPSTGECVALFNNLGGSSSHAVAFDPHSPATQTSRTLSVFLVDVSCPSITRCTAVAPITGEQYSFDPTNAAAVATHSTIDSGHELMHVACSVSTQCTAVDTAGQEVSFDPTGVSTPTTVNVSGGGALNGVACPTSSQCTAVGDRGQEVTFSPAATTAPPSAMIDASNSLTGVACPSGSQCTASDHVGQVVTFDPSTLSTHAPVRIDSTRGQTGISCPSAAQCTTLDIFGSALTFNPLSPGTPTATPVTSNILPGPLSCPTLGQCTLVDFAGETTFDPNAPGTPPSVPITGGSNYTDVSCPTSGQCTVVNASGQAATFNPAFPGSPSAVSIDGSTGIFGVSCPSASVCVAVDGVGRAIVFDPNNLAGAHATTVDSGLPFTDVACPSTTFCVASDAAGDVVEGNPATGVWTHDAVPGAGALQSVACVSDVQCVAVDATGQAFAGAPLPAVSSAPTVTGVPVKGETLSGQHGTWSSAPTGYAYAWQRCDANGGACTTIPSASGASYTLASADVGHTIRLQVTASNIVGAGAPALSAATAPVQASGSPVNRSLPRITGAAKLGAQLSASTGTWAGVAPISFSYAWQICRPACSKIVGATRSSFRLTAAQAGFRVRVIVTARNRFGATSATSNQSGPISPTAAQIRTALLRAAVPTGLNARIAAILAQGGVTVSFAAPAAGTGQLAWYYVPRGAHLAAARKPTLVASGRISTTRARQLRVRLKLTGPGKRLLRGATSRTLTATGTFTLSHGLRAGARRTIVLR